ncbi:MAB_1171c family putative transporter [Nocardia pneumoniae]|uniref:MAB_1171c family putative transporter n=1 Tax=Nocardia pneumoniae TaxID=228601 RepID=UPI00031D32DA|nr:MAB_1171c family putative transporter [Nocardia pneumoniae]
MWFAAVYGGIGAFAFAAFLWRIGLALRSPDNPARWAVAFAILAAGIGFEAAVPQTYTWLGDVSSIPNLASLVVYGAIATAVLAQIVWTGFMVAPQEPDNRAGRRILALPLLVLAVLALLFTMAPVHDESHPTDFDDHYAKVPLAVAFLGVYLTVYSAALIRIILLCRGWIGEVDQIWLRRGLRLLAVGSTIALGYSVGKVIAIVAAWFGIGLRRLNTDIAPAFASLGATVMLVGYLCPSLAPWLLHTVARLRALPRLRPLWLALREVAPELAHTSLRRPDARDRVYRRVIEIRDWLLRLQPHLSAEATAVAERLATELAVPERTRAAAIEAARIAAALRAHRLGLPPTLDDESFTEPDQSTLAGELAWLVEVAGQFDTAPLVPATLAALAAEVNTGGSAPAHDGSAPPPTR